MEINELHRFNLKKLAEHLASLPEDYEHFDMSRFIRGESGFRNDLIAGQSITQCGAVACAIGHCTSIGLPLCLNEYSSSLIDWRLTGLMHFGVDSHMEYGPWDWMFSSSWCSVDNSPLGAAKRIQWFLKYGLPSEEEYCLSLRGDAELIYY